MADDIQVRFGGDAGGIRTAADQAKGTIQSFATAARGQNATARQSYDELKAAIDAADASLRQIQASAENTSALATQARAVAALVAAYEGLRGQVDEANRVTEALEKLLEVIERRNATLARTPLDAGQLADATAGPSAAPRRPGSIRRPAGSTCCASACRARAATPPR